MDQFESAKIRHKIMLDDLKEVIKSRSPTLNTEKKWKVRDILRSAQVNLAFKEITEYTQTGKQGLGTNVVKN